MPPAFETLYFPSPEDLDNFFREGREAFNPIYVQKMATISTFFSRVPTQPWILNAGTSQRGFRLGRQWYDPTTPWRLIKSDRCTQNSCDSVPETIQRAGTQSYTYHLLRKEMQTVQFCVQDLLMRLMPAEEILAMEQSNALITKHVYEEFNRQNWLGSAGHHYIGIANPDSTYCGQFNDAAWFFPALSDPEGGYDTRYVYVGVDPTQSDAFDNIALLSLDLLDDILVDLNDEDDAFRLDLQEAFGMPLLDVIVPDPRTMRRLEFQSKQDRGWDNSMAGYDAKQTMAKLGINRVIADYALTYDRDALRYNVDSAYNTALVNGNGYAFSATDTSTWPRLIRVPRYVKTQVEIGCDYIPNPDYRNADFGISIPFTEKGYVQHFFPNGNTGYGSVRMEDQNFAGMFEWIRFRSTDDPKAKMGWFSAEFILAGETKDPTIMNAVLHRLEKNKNLQGACCALNNYTPPSDLDCWTCSTGGTTEVQQG